MSILDQLTNKINSKLGVFEGVLDDINQTNETLLNAVSQIFEVAIQILKIFVVVFENIADHSKEIVLLIPALFIIFVVSKLSQIL